MKIYNARAILARFALAVILASSFCGASNAQTSNSPVTIHTRSDSSFDFDMRDLKGKVALVFHWSTSCSVCLDKMNELRNNMSGWRGRSFAIVAINHDKNRQDFQDYIRIHKAVNGESGQFIHIFNKDLAVDSLYQNEHLPTSFLVDSQQVLKRTYVGRIPPEAWDDIAELIP
jgi:cytochrome oxidase Cu insertion factor (SCO1/SenC/PrrC family)